MTNIIINILLLILGILFLVLMLRRREGFETTDTAEDVDDTIEDNLPATQEEETEEEAVDTEGPELHEEDQVEESDIIDDIEDLEDIDEDYVQDVEPESIDEEELEAEEGVADLGLSDYDDVDANVEDTFVEDESGTGDFEDEDQYDEVTGYEDDGYGNLELESEREATEPISASVQENTKATNAELNKIDLNRNMFKVQDMTLQKLNENPQVDKRIQDKYLILQQADWTKSKTAKDLQKRGCMCPATSPWINNFMTYQD